MHVTGADYDEYLEHSLLTTTSNPAFCSVPSETFQPSVVWYCNLFAAQRTKNLAMFARKFGEHRRFPIRYLK